MTLYCVDQDRHKCISCIPRTRHPLSPPAGKTGKSWWKGNASFKQYDAPNFAEQTAPPIISSSYVLF